MDSSSYISFNEMMQPLQRVHDIDEKCLLQLIAQIKRILAEAESHKVEIEKGKK